MLVGATVLLLNSVLVWVRAVQVGPGDQVSPPTPEAALHD